jgi:hypothetical protein
MQVKTFTYKKMLGTFHLQHMLSSEKMDDHIAQMLQDGWEVMSTTSLKGTSGLLGSQRDPDKIVMTYKKD